MYSRPGCLSSQRTAQRHSAIASTRTCTNPEHVNSACKQAKMLSLNEDSTKALSCITARLRVWSESSEGIVSSVKGSSGQGSKRVFGKEVVLPLSPCPKRPATAKTTEMSSPGHQLALQPSGCHSQGYLATLRGDRTNADKQTSPLHDAPDH